MNISSHHGEDKRDFDDLSQSRLHFTCGVLALVILIADFLTPLGVATGVTYIVVVLVSLRSPQKQYTIVVTLICTVLVVIGYFGSPKSEIPAYQVYSNRALSILAIWVTAILAIIQREKNNLLHKERLKIAKSLREIELQQEKLKVLRATMCTVQDITGNFLNNLQFFTFEIERSRTLSPESVQKLDALIHDTSQKIQALGNVDQVREKKMAGNVIGIDYDNPERTQSSTAQHYTNQIDKEKQ